MILFRPAPDRLAAILLTDGPLDDGPGSPLGAPVAGADAITAAWRQWLDDGREGGERVSGYL